MNSSRFLDRFALIGCIITAAAVFGPEPAGRLEGAVWPVVEDFQISQAEGWSGDLTVEGTMEIVRAGQCEDPVVIATLVSKDGRMSAIPEIEFSEHRVRTNGEQGIGLWRMVGVSPDLFSQLQLEVSHQCWIDTALGRVRVPWRTVTDLWPPVDETGP